MKEVACVILENDPQGLHTGAEDFMLSPSVFAVYGRRVAVVANQTSIVGTTHLVDTLLSAQVHVTKIFCPEHGFRGKAEAGARVDNSTDPRTGLPIVSLYGKNKKPTAEQMADIDLVIFDLQDVGCRFYTYLSTLHYVMEACAESQIPLIVLDRPNPNGHYIDGPVLEPAQRSFVGMHPVPVVYGMTIGEYANMINQEGWLKDSLCCDLTISKMRNYRRDSIYPLPVAPSPNLRNQHAIALYPSLCLLEGTTVSVGRGTPWPFEVIGSGKDTLDLRHVEVPSYFDLHYIRAMMQRTPRGQFFLKNNFFDKLAGTSTLRQQLQEGWSDEQIRASWQPALDHFKTIRKKYLLYP